MNVAARYRQRDEDASGAASQFQHPTFRRGNEAPIEGNIRWHVRTQIVVLCRFRPNII